MWVTFNLLGYCLESTVLSFIIFLKIILSFWFVKLFIKFVYLYEIKAEDIVEFKFSFRFSLTPYLWIYDFMLFIYFFYLFLILFSFYISSEEKTIGRLIIKKLLVIFARYLKEVEKELLSIDDIYFIVLTLFIIFSWFYFLCIIPANMQENVLSYIFFMIPFMISLVVFIPMFIIYDQGAFFLTYLRGTTSTIVFILELIFDYMCIIIIFIRIIIQNLRFFFMFLVYFEVHEFVQESPKFSYIPWPDPYLGEAGIYFIFPKNIKWFIMFKLPTIIVYMIYYIGHLYAVFISNTISYVFLVFWLYLFFYSCFFTRRFENFFNKRYKRHYKRNNKH